MTKIERTDRDTSLALGVDPSIDQGLDHGRHLRGLCLTPISSCRSIFKIRSIDYFDVLMLCKTGFCLLNFE